MVRQVDNDLLTAEEKASLDEEIEQFEADSQTRISITYHSMGAETWNKETGAITETSGSTTNTIYALVVRPTQEEMVEMKIQQHDKVYLVRKATLDGESVTPKLNDYIVESSDNRYIYAISHPMPYIHYKFFTRDKGN